MCFYRSGQLGMGLSETSHSLKGTNQKQSLCQKWSETSLKFEIQKDIDRDEWGKNRFTRSEQNSGHLLQKSLGFRDSSTSVQKGQKAKRIGQKAKRLSPSSHSLFSQ